MAGTSAGAKKGWAHRRGGRVDVMRSRLASGLRTTLRVRRTAKKFLTRPGHRWTPGSLTSRINSYLRGANLTIGVVKSARKARLSLRRR